MTPNPRRPCLAPLLRRPPTPHLARHATGALPSAMALVAALVLGNAGAQTMCDVSAGMDLPFASHASALGAVEREKIRMAAERIRGADYCPFAGLHVRGHADQTEGLPAEKQALSLARANEVARLFELNGIPKHLIDIAASADQQPVVPPPSSKNPRVEVQVYAGCPSPTCPFPAKGDGLRLWK